MSWSHRARRVPRYDNHILNLKNNPVYMCVVCVGTRVYVWVQEYEVCVGPRLTLGVLHHFPPYLWRVGLSVKPGAHCRASS